MVLESESDDSAIDDSKLGKLNYFEIKKNVFTISRTVFIFSIRRNLQSLSGFTLN